MVDYSNVPRKKPKFMNFMKNSFRGFGVNDSMLNEIWSVIENIDKQQQQQQQQQKQQPQNGTNGTKRKIEEEEQQQESAPKKLKESDDSDSSFNWFDAIKSVLSQKENGLTLKKLEKKVNSFNFHFMIVIC